jgi:hypothetical protein
VSFTIFLLCKFADMSCCRAAQCAERPGASV